MRDEKVSEGNADKRIRIRRDVIAAIGMYE